MQWTVVVVVAGLVIMPGIVFIWLMADASARDKLKGALNGAQRGWAAGATGARVGARSARSGALSAGERIGIGLSHVQSVAIGELAEYRRVERRIREHPKLAARPELAHRGLSEGARRGFAERWYAAQAQFLDDPRRAIADADGLVEDVIRARGHRQEDEYRDGGDATAGYRELRGTPSGDSLEEQRRRMLRYRSLFETLLMDEQRSATQMGTRVVPRG